MNDIVEQLDTGADEPTKHLLMQIDIIVAAVIVAGWERETFLHAAKLIYERNYEVLAKREFPPLEDDDEEEEG